MLSNSEFLFLQNVVPNLTTLIEGTTATGECITHLAGLVDPIDIHNCAAETFIAEYNYSGHELIYSDPPYLHSTRSSNSRYRYEYSEQQHIELLALLKTRPCNVILSGYPSKLYEDLLPGWNTREFQVMTRGGVRTEKLWFNFEPGSRHWATFAGKNFTDRQRIKRKAERWAKNYRALPDDEKTAVLSAILSQPDPA